MFVFLKYFLVLFVFIGCICLFNGLYVEAFFLFGSVAVIKLLDSDWAEDNLNGALSETLKISVIIFTILVNGYIASERLMEQPFLIKATHQQKESYVKFEKQIFDSLADCTNAHNIAIYRIRKLLNVEDEHKENIKNSCSDAVLALNNITVESSILPDKLTKLMLGIKSEYKSMILNILLLNYKYNDNYDKAISSTLKYNQENAYKKITKIRKMMTLSFLSNDKKNIILLNN